MRSSGRSDTDPGTGGPETEGLARRLDKPMGVLGLVFVLVVLGQSSSIGARRRSLVRLTRSADGPGTGTAGQATRAGMAGPGRGLAG